MTAQLGFQTDGQKMLCGMVALTPEVALNNGLIAPGTMKTSYLTALQKLGFMA
jgi:hypothetical protein